MDGVFEVGVVGDVGAVHIIVADVVVVSCVNTESVVGVVVVGRGFDLEVGVFDEVFRQSEHFKDGSCRSVSWCRVVELQNLVFVRSCYQSLLLLLKLLLLKLLRMLLELLWKLRILDL